jgi:hydroxymethylglutaryl-CoA synthase
MSYPEHGGRFTGEPAYFKHVMSAARGIMEKCGTSPKDYDYVVFHQPNGKFPVSVSRKLGFTMEQIETGLLVRMIGNTYSASSLLGLTATLDVSSPGERILLTSFGSGAGSDAFSMIVTDEIEHRNIIPSTMDMINNKKYLDYALYSKHQGKIMM